MSGKNLVLNLTLNALDNVTKPFRNIRSQTVALSRALGDNKTKLKQLKAAQDRVKNSGIANVQERFKNRIHETNRAIEQQKLKLQELNRIAQRQRNYANQVNTLKTASDNVKNFGRQTITMGMAGAGVGTLLIKPAVEFEQAMSKVEALTRLDKNNPEQAEKLKKLAEQAQHLGATTALTSKQVAEGQGYFAMAGFTPEQILSAMPAALDMSLAFDMDLGRVSDIISDTLSAFKISADETERVVDVLTLTATTSNTTPETIYETIKKSAPILTAAGQSFETAAGLTGLQGNVGIKGSEAGTTLKNMTANLAAPSKGASKMLSSLNVKTLDKHGNLRQVPEILKDIMQATEKMGTGKRIKVFDEIFGKIGLAGATELVSQADGIIQQYEKSLHNAQGTAKQVSKTMTDNFMGDIASFLSAKEDLGVAIYQTVNEDLRKFVSQITEVVRSISAWMRANPELTATIAKWTGILSVAAVAMGGLSVALGFIVYPIGRVVLSISRVIGCIGRLSMAFLRAVPSILSFSAAMLTNPLAWIVVGITAVIAAIVLLWKNWDSVCSWVAEKWDWLCETVATLWQPIGQFFSDIWQQIDEFFHSGIGNITKTILDWSPLGLFYKAFAGVLNWFGVDLPNSFTQFGSNLIDKFTSGALKALDTMKKTMGKAVDWIKEKLGFSQEAEVKINETKQKTEQVSVVNNAQNTTPLQQKWVGGLVEKAKGFATGGYTGNGGKYQPAGIVHAGEYVMTKQATAKLGVPLLNALNYGKNALIGTGLGLSVAMAQPIQIDDRPPLKATTSQMVTQQPMQVSITVNANAGQDPQAIAREVARQLQQIQSQQQAQRRSSLRDRD
ncbi:phage tail tape measure protein [Lonepinella sp. BR2271]|uniref:phage tail tape measure protein n=1 Tax=Lonepinella sp. BR2271 TaxID=3434550 RepID=UPI003F6DE484